MPTIRSRPEDFFVEEIPLYPPDGTGPFLWLWVEKRERNTHDVAEALARGLDLPSRDVGWAGRKDRIAVTRQAFTVPATAKGGAVEPRLAGLDLVGDLEGVQILRVDRCRQRLRAGELEGNRFRLVVRDVDADAAEEAKGRLDTLVRRGLPNRFGDQRYGRDGRNVERGLEVLRRDAVRGDKRRAMFMVSALQSKVFDAVLDARAHDALLPGDLAVVHATGDWLRVEQPEAFADRLERFAISPTGPIFGTKVKRPEGEAGALERRILDEILVAGGLEGFDPATFEPPDGLRLTGDRRPLRVRPRRASLEYAPELEPGENVAILAFDLPAGSYATVLVEALFDRIVE